MTDLSGLRPRRLARAKAASAFWHRNYRLFFVGQAISLIGTWVQQVAQGWLVLTLTRRSVLAWAWSPGRSSCR